jgi:dsDNA-binding SOS-regulon protein
MTIFVANFKTNKMKKYLFLTLVMAFTFSVSAQKLPSTKKLSKEAVDKTVKVTENTEEQVKTALLKDKGLQKEALSFLKSNPETTVAMALDSTSIGAVCVSVVFCTSF